MRPHLLLLGGTAEARELAAALVAGGRWHVTLSLAGRTASPPVMPAPTRSGGFGGAAGLADWMRGEGVRLLVDATHPFAARISRNAAKAAATTGVALLALRRPPWYPSPGDDWRPVADMATAVAALGTAPRRVFLALGRQEVAAFEAAPWHDYLIRSVDPILPPPALPRTAFLTARGPFARNDERDLLRARGIEAIVCKNSGGTASAAKLGAARDLGIPVIMVERPELPAADAVPDVAGALARIAAHAARLGV